MLCTTFYAHLTMNFFFILNFWVYVYHYKILLVDIVNNCLTYFCHFSLPDSGEMKQNLGEILRIRDALIKSILFKQA